MQIRCNFSDISYLSETQKNNFQFLNETYSPNSDILIAHPASVTLHFVSGDATILFQRVPGYNGIADLS